MGRVKATPNFVGERLAEAREARGYNRAQLAEALGITRQSVSQYEKNLTSPTSQILDEAAKFLRVPLHRFTRSMADKPSGDALFFRCLASATKIARSRAERRLAWVEDICAYLREAVEFPPLNCPEFDVPEDPIALDHEDVERLAQQTRRFWGLGDGPIADVVMLLENNGAIVVRQEIGANSLDAFSRWNMLDNTPYIVLGTDKDTAVRSRINAAHELGHMILHRKIPYSAAKPEVHRLLEAQAFHFAGAFLLPEATFSAELTFASIQTFMTLKPRWRVSIGAMIQRAKEIGVITTTDAERLFIYRAQRGWARREPFDDEMEAEEPRLIERAFDLLLSQRVSTRASIEASLAMYASDIEKAAGLDMGFFDDDVKHFKFPKLNPGEPPFEPPAGELLA